MSQKTVIKCDICGIESGVTNGWFIVIRNSSFSAYPQKDFQAGVGLLDICGAYCLMKILGIWINTLHTSELQVRKTP